MPLVLDPVPITLAFAVPVSEGEYRYWKANGDRAFEYYNQTTGVSVYRSPNVDSRARYLYFDPIDQLPEEGQERWADVSQHDAIVAEALKQ